MEFILIKCTLIFEIQARRKKNKEKLNNAILNGLTNAGVEVVFGEATILDQKQCKS